MADELTIAKHYFIDHIKPVLNRQGYSVICAIGGSCAYGFSDESSDLDVFLMTDAPHSFLVEELRAHLFTHIVLNVLPVQFIPSLPHTPLYDYINCSVEKPDIAYQITDLYHISKMIAIEDNDQRLLAAQERIAALDEPFWSEATKRLCSEHIDILSDFYSCARRDKDLGGMIGFAQALKGLIQIYHLANRMLYPNDKWLIANCRKYFLPFYESLMVGHVQLVAQGFSTDAFIGFIRKTTDVVVGALELQKCLPDYIIRDLINP